MATLGNHDVNSRSGDSRGDAFYLARHFDPDFPSERKAERESFWANGFFSRVIGGVHVVVLNTAYHHHDEVEAGHGTFALEDIQELDVHLTSKAPGTPILAVMHHHPVLHSTGSFASSDVLPTGDQLIETLSRHGCEMIIHGHRHHPRLKREMRSGKSIIVVGAGSFSVHLSKLGTSTRNLFHHFEGTIKLGKGPEGVFRSWEWSWTDGWRCSSERSARIPHRVLLGAAPRPGLYQSVVDWLRARRASYTTQAELQGAFHEVDTLLPDELGALAAAVDATGEYRLERDELGGLRGVGRYRHPRKKG